MYGELQASLWDEAEVGYIHLKLSQELGIPPKDGSPPKAAPGFHFRLLRNLHDTEQERHRITESQNGRGWKGPLWVI